MANNSRGGGAHLISAGIANQKQPLDRLNTSSDSLTKSLVQLADQQKHERRVGKRRHLVKRTTNASLDDSLSKSSPEKPILNDTDNEESLETSSQYSDDMSSIGWKSVSYAPPGRIISSSTNARSKKTSISCQNSVSSLGSVTSNSSRGRSISSISRSNRSKALVRRESNASLGASLHGPENDDYLPRTQPPMIGLKKNVRVSPLHYDSVRVRKDGQHQTSKISYSKRGNRKICFGSVSIKEYGIEIGDNPSCSRGPAVSLGWKVSKIEHYKSIDKYERIRQPQRYQNSTSMVLKREEREEMLLKNGFSREKIVDAVRKIVKVKNQRRQTVHNLPVMKVEEMVEVAGKKVKRLFLPRRYTTTPGCEVYLINNQQSKCEVMKKELKPSLTSSGNSTKVEYDGLLQSMVLRKLSNSSKSAIIADEPDMMDDIFNKSITSEVTLTTSVTVPNIKTDASQSSSTSCAISFSDHTQFQRDTLGAPVT